ncbi:flagellar basal-body MS-ring/collar protein FliF [Noviherbaspirillum sp.]|uniref:flagellar basal-body MS-ring/collar protein FliF n=1 Tax=Noviherbaspirillum sp. TaxID=1926288 RepID=UPI002B471E49|nr:flagellar basal-body MS-ring/collar protein FliF [Noviherbaspirillum sp.]HJV79609.1 flagellar basal-body MS-ring/collar protein FliF [Noviherbaspirillum sp.]
MAVAGENAVVPAGSGIVGFAQTPGGRNFFLMLGVAAVAAVMSGVWMWSQQPDYRVLFSNFSDRDGGAIVSSLQQMNVPYKFAEGGAAILVPGNQVHDVRLKLASQGLPKGGSVGFELMENQKLGVSQFLEQVNFQRALEGELARSIQSLAAVQAARVHLALPKASVFIRDQQKPTASVLLNLHAGRTLDEQQVSAIVHLVASSVPDLPTKNVTVVDQNGNLLSEVRAPGSGNGLDPTQLKYVQELQQNIVKRIESILTPIVGLNNVRAEATADVDFSHTEQAAEIYKPNQAPNTSAIRSQQLSESQNGAPATASGVPGALSNQPPAPATAPLTAPTASANAAAPAAAAAAASGNAHKDMTVNYEVDKTVRYTQQPMGGIQRLSVAVVVNYKKEIGKDGKVTMKPLSDAEKAQITDLVKEAMGFSKDRGDSLNVVNSPFAGAEKEVIPETPIWKRPEALNMAMGAGKYVLAAAILAYLFFAVLKPLLRKIAKTFEPPAAPPETAVAQISHDVEPMGSKQRTYQDNLDAAKQLARNDPKMVANVVKAWVGTNE